MENYSSEISPMTLWTAHKWVVRGGFISIASKEGKDKQACINALSACIHPLEKAHKQSLATQTLQSLVQARNELLEELGKITKRNYALTHRLFYEFGNKSRKLLARALQVKKATSTVHEITNPTGCKIVPNYTIYPPQT